MSHRTPVKMSTLSLLLSPVQLSSSLHGPTERCLAHLSLLQGVESPGIEGNAGRRKGGMEFAYQRHKVAIVVDISASLFQLTSGQSLMLDTLEEVLFRLWSVLDKSQTLLLSVLFSGASGCTVAMHSYPVFSLHHLQEVLLSAQSTLQRLLLSPPASLSLPSLLSVGLLALSLMPPALPCLILISDFTCGSVNFSHYGDVAMDVQSRDIQVVLWPLLGLQRTWGFLNPEFDLKSLAEGLHGSIARKAEDIDERVFVRISRLRTVRSAGNRTNRILLNSYQSECGFTSFLRCRLAEGFRILSYSDENMTFYRQFRPDLDLEVTITRFPQLKVSIQALSATNSLRSRQKGAIAAFIRKMKLAEAVLATMDQRKPPPASLSVLEHLLPCRWLSLLSPQPLWSQIKSCLQAWSSETYSDMLYLRENEENVTWLRVERCWENLVELLIMDWKGEKDLADLKNMIQEIGCWVYEGRISTILIEELSGSAQTRPDEYRPAAGFLQSCGTAFEFRAENAVSKMAELIEDCREKEGFVRLETADRGKRLYVKLDAEAMLQYLLTLTPSLLHTTIYTLPHSSPRPLLPQDLQLYTHFSHFRYLQRMCLSQLTNQDGGPKRFVEESTSTCSVFKVLMRTLGEEGQGVLAMVSEDDYMRCFGEMDRVELYREMYRRLGEVEDAETATETMAEFLSGLEGDSKQQWQPGSSDLHPLILATFQSVSDCCVSQSGCTYFLRHISPWELLVWRLQEGILEIPTVKVFRYQLKEGRGRGEAETAWNLAEKALGAALTHYVFDELFHSPVPLVDLQHTLSLCNRCTVSISLCAYQEVMERCGRTLGDRMGKAVEGLETLWKQLWSKQFYLHSDKTVFYSKHPTQLLFLQLNPCQSDLYPALNPPSLQLQCYSHSSHGFSTTVFRKSIQSLIEELTQGVERIVGQFELEVMRLAAVLDSQTLTAVASLFSAVSEVVETQMELAVVHGGSEEDLRKELRSQAVLQLREVDSRFVLLSVSGLPATSPFFPADFLPFWCLFTVKSPALVLVQAVLPLETKAAAPSLQEDLQQVRNTLETRLNQRILLRKVLETGLCSPLLAPNCPLSLPTLYCLPLALGPRLALEAAFAAISDLFATFPYQVSPQKDLFRFIVASDVCTLFRIANIDSISLALEVYSLDKVEKSLILPIWTAAKDRISALSISLLALELVTMTTISAIDINLIATESQKMVFSVQNPDKMGGYLRQIVKTVLREVEKQDGKLGYLYNSQEKDNMGEGLAWVEVTIGKDVEITIKTNRKELESALAGLLESCVAAGRLDCSVEELIRSDPWLFYTSLANLTPQRPTFPHYSPLASLSILKSSLISALETVLGPESLINSYQSSRETKGFWLEGEMLIIATCTDPETMLYRPSEGVRRSLFCCFLVTNRDLQGVYYNLETGCRERLRELLEKLRGDYRAAWGRRYEERMGKLGLIGRQLIEFPIVQPSVPASVLPFSLSSLCLPPTAPFPLSPLPPTPHPARLQRYQDLLPAFDPWSQRHHLTLPASVLPCIETESFLVGLWNSESAFLMRMQGNAEGREAAERLLGKVREGVKEKLSFEEAVVGRGKVGKMQRSRTEKELGKGLGKSPIHLKRILNDSLLLLSLSLDPPYFSFRLSCLQSLLRVLNPAEPSRQLDSLHKEIAKCRKELKGSRLVFDAEAVLLGELLLERPGKAFKSLYDAGKELVGSGHSWEGVEGDFSLDTGLVFSQSVSTLFAHIASQPGEFHLFRYSEFPVFLFQVRNAANKVLFPGGFCEGSLALEAERMVEVVILYRESLFRSRKVLGLTSTPSTNILNLEYLVLTRGPGSPGLRAAVRSLMADAITRSIRGVQREMGWSRVIDQGSVTAEDITGLLANSYQMEIAEECRGPLDLLQGVFSVEVFEYLGRIHAGRCRLVQDQTNWQLLIVVSSAEIVYMKVGKLDGRLEVSPLIRSLPPPPNSFFLPVLNQVFQWLYIQLAC